MSKRGAISELSDRNWDVEEEPEEAGVFTQASKDVLQQRTIKKAKRRGVADESLGSKPMAFSGFSGLGSKLTQPKPTLDSAAKNTGGSTIFGGKPSAFSGTSSINGNEDQKLKGQGDSKESSYLEFLKSLNESVLAWIKKHVEDSPYIILTPVFRDYEKYLESYEAEHSPTRSPASKRDGAKDSKTTDNPASISSKGGGSLFPPKSAGAETEEKLDISKAKPFSFGQTTAETSLPKTGFSFSATPTTSSTAGTGFKFSTSSSQPGTGFSFGLNNATTATTTAATVGLMASKPAFSFGSTASSQGSFSFGAGTSMQGSSAAGASQDAEGNNDDDEYVPPKPEVKEIVENDALYSKRCKLYYQKDSQWVDRGVGNIHLKQLDGDKTQILVRADTNLGNILLNVMLSSSMPVSRQGKNNVFLVCVPNPPINPKADKKDETPVPMLIRVKTGEDADELFDKIDERKKLL